MAKILIPTPLRPYTDKQDAVDASGATVGELLADLTRRHSGLKAHLFNDQGKLRSFVNVYVNDEDIRYLQKEQTPVNAGDTVSIIPSVAGGVDTVEDVRRSDLGRMGEPLTNDEVKRYCAASHHAGGRRRRSAQAQGVEGALHRRRRTRIAGGDVPRRGRRRHARHRRLRHRRFQQPAAADPPRHAGRRPFEAGVGEGSSSTR